MYSHAYEGRSGLTRALFKLGQIARPEGQEETVNELFLRAD